MTDESEITLTLRSSDSVTFTVKKRDIVASTTIKDLIEDIGVSTDEIPLNNVDGATLKKIIEYCEQYKGQPSAPTESSSTTINEWDAAFIDMPMEPLFKLILGANYLAVIPLLHLGCKKVASILKTNTTEDIKKMFGVTRDFTPEEEKAARDDPAWVANPGRLDFPV